MLRNFLKNRKAQNTAEYALLIALVVAGVIAMQTYAQRALQARIQAVSVHMTTGSDVNAIGNSTQYEPYYLSSNYTVETTSNENKRLGQGTVAYDMTTNRFRAAGGGQNEYFTAGDMNRTL